MKNKSAQVLDYRSQVNQAIRSRNRQQIINTYRIKLAPSNNPIPQTTILQIIQQIFNDQGIDSYLKYKSVISSYLQNQSEIPIHVQSQLVQLAPFLYQSMVQASLISRYDQQSIQILKYITSMDSIKLPQTQELAQWIKQMINQMKYDAVCNSLWITANLFGQHRYRLVLKPLLFQVGYFEAVIQIFENASTLKILHQKVPESLILASQILMTILTIPSIFNKDLRFKILDVLNQLIKVQQKVKWMIARQLGSLRYQSNQNDQDLDAKFMLSAMQDFIIKNNYGLEEDCIFFIEFCCRNSIYSQNPAIHDFLQRISQRNLSWSLCLAEAIINSLNSYFDQQLIHPSPSLISSCLLCMAQIPIKKCSKTFDLLCQSIQNDPSIIYQFSCSSSWDILLDRIIEIITEPIYENNINIKELVLQFVWVCTQFEESEGCREQFSFIQWVNVMGAKQGIQRIFEIAQEQWKSQLTDQAVRLAENILDIVNRH